MLFSTLPPYVRQAAQAGALLAGGTAATALLVLVYLITSSLFRFAAASLGFGRYAHIPTAKHRGAWYTIPFLGDFPYILKSPTTSAHLEFKRDAGGSNVVLYRHLLYRERLQICDPVAMRYILDGQRSYSFPKSAAVRRFLVRLLGSGLLVVEGEEHKRQRRILQPAFSVSAVRDLTPTFFKHASKLTAKLDSLVEQTTGPADKPFLQGQSEDSAKASQAAKPVFDVSFWLSRATLDIIGEAGFGRNLGSLEQEDEQGDELAEAFHNVLGGRGPSVWGFLILLLQSYPGFGWLSLIKTKRDIVLRDSLAVMERVSKDIIEDKRRQILQEMSEASGKEKTVVSKSDWEDTSSAGKDLIMLMMRSNMSTDLRESERLADSELLGQMTTLLLAGHETTATLTTWTLYELARNQAVQDKLRAELREHAVGREELSHDELSALPYLDAVVKETLRQSCPVASTSRYCEHDDVIPLSKEYPRSDGKGTFNSIAVKKGDEIVVHVAMINTSEDLWGPDALEFKPERWFDLPRTARNNGLPLHLLSFISGPRGCIGSRFAMIEAKALLFKLITNFQFDPVEGWEIERRTTIVMRSRVIGQEALGPQMPLRVSRLAA